MDKVFISGIRVGTTIGVGMMRIAGDHRPSRLEVRVGDISFPAELSEIPFC